MIGNLNKRANILAPSLTPDGGGGASQSWQVAATVWCSVEPATGEDAFASDAVQSRVQYKIVARRYALIEAGMRAAVSNRLFAIHAVLDEGDPAQTMTLLCEELP
jgi:SPP1 family predicted phage head-tail adaptor